MPIKSAKQFRMMQASANSDSRGIGGVNKKVAKEFFRKTSKKKKSMFAHKGD